jgi:DNA-binding MarR family transcriptional regulator
VATNSWPEEFVSEKADCKTHLSVARVFNAGDSGKLATGGALSFGKGRVMPDVDLLPTLSLSIFMDLQVFDSIWNDRLGEFVRDHWDLRVNDVLALIIADSDPLTSQGEIGHKLLLHANVMVAIMKRLRKRNLVIVKPHPHDRRKQIIVPTAKGRHICREVRIHHAEMIRWALPLRSADRRRLANLTTSVINQWRQNNGKN